MNQILSEITFLFQRLNWLSIVDLLLVALIIYAIFLMLRDTQAMVLLRGVLLLIIVIALLGTFADLPAFNWLMSNALPALLFAIPVVFAPEIRRGLERLGRAGSGTVGLLSPSAKEVSPETINAIVAACGGLSGKQHGALIAIQRQESLTDYIKTGVRMNSSVTAELLMQIFYPNTPLHDGAVIIRGDAILAASCVMPLSASGVLQSSPERQMGLRHRAALGISEVSDAVIVVVSEQTGGISIAHNGKIIRKLDVERLRNILTALLQDINKKRRKFDPVRVIRDWLGLSEKDE